MTSKDQGYSAFNVPARFQPGYEEHVFQPAFYQAIVEVDQLILQAESHHDQERLDRGDDVRRLARYTERRKALVAHRKKLVQIYADFFGNDPWAEIAF